MEVETSQGKMSDKQLVDRLTYSSYKFNRLRSPQISPQRWAAIFPQGPALEAMFQMEQEARKMVEELSRDGTYVRHTLVGQLDEVVARMREILARYHPTGYDTKVLELGAAAYNDSEGRWKCVVRRLASCE